jgi:frataxin-like iron-binding protein CyaY
MFWSQFILAKQGPLGTVWIAAHSVNASKLRKSQVSETDLAESCGAPPSRR